MIILITWLITVVVSLYLWLGIMIYEDINTSYKLSLIPSMLIIFLWAIIIPILMLANQCIKLYYIIRECLR